MFGSLRSVKFRGIQPGNFVAEGVPVINKYNIYPLTSTVAAVRFLLSWVCIRIDIYVTVWICVGTCVYIYVQWCVYVRL